MLSVAKHLLIPLKTEEKQIPRFARDDMLGDFFRNMLG